MDVYILDNQLRRVEVVDTFQSLIWTERYADIGDLQITISATEKTRQQFTPGTQLAINGSYRVMVVESVEDVTDDEDRKLLNISGRSLEVVLLDRVARNTYSALDTIPTWDITGTPGFVARTMFTDICVTGVISTKDRIPYIQPGTIFPADTIPEPSTTITWNQEPDSLYKAIKDVCDAYDLGFRLVRNFDTSELYFNVYTGSDRTTAQSILPPVVFGTTFDSLENTTEFSTVKNVKNVAYVVHPTDGMQVVLPLGVATGADGFARKVLHLKAGAELNTAALREQFAREELAKYRAFYAFDGELNLRSNYQYGVNYGLGDLVEFRNDDGIGSIRRVTEQIFVHDREGERSYPTLTAPEA